jgi:hypothetical protein
MLASDATSAPKPQRLLLRYSLAMLFIATAVVAAVLAPLVNRVHHQERVIEKVRRLGGSIHFAHDLDADNQPSDRSWLRTWLGDAYFREVKSIDLQNSDATNDLVAELSAIGTLEQLGLSQTRIDDRALPYVARLSQLKALDIGFSSITNEGLIHLAPLKDLVVLDLSVTKIDDDGLPALQQLNSLYQLDLYGTAVTDRGTAVLLELPLLAELDIANTQITDGGVATLAKHSKLRRLRLDQMTTGQGQEQRITDASTPHLAAMSQLSDLGLISLAISDQGLAALQASKTLRRLALNNCQYVTQQGVQNLQAACPQLTIEH